MQRHPLCWGEAIASNPGAPPPHRDQMLKRLVDVRGEEMEALCWSFLSCFCLLCGYSILKPIRDEMGITGSVGQLPWLFTGTFVAILVALPLYSTLVAQLPRHRVIPLVYRFFLLNLLAFYALLRLGVAREQVARSFFIWVSVYNLFVVTAFWSLLADLFESEQGKRLFGFIAAGGTAGMLVGPALTAALVKPVGAANLILLSALLLELGVRYVRRLVRWSHEARPGRAAAVPLVEEPLGGRGALAGLALLLRSPYLLGLGLQTVLYTVTSTFLYVQQLQIVSSASGDSATRTSMFAGIELAASITTLAVQLFLTGRLIERLGLAPALGVSAALTALGFFCLAVAPLWWLVTAFQAIRRASHFAFERPAREILFTSVGREEKYQSKGLIDTVVYRGGDMTSGWLQSGLTSLGLGASGTALAAVPIAGLWLAVSLFLARRQEALARRRAAEAAVPPAMST